MRAAIAWAGIRGLGTPTPVTKGRHDVMQELSLH
ncbi:hypothetical protein FHS89_001623 [Rubricella aquisinus]|uniref:Uncharacterized protein n=1 Tax=Rubricella aquisinus TaxID=2028108 RepID=A0A840WM31_9RHOB|nr:hypothetical protein [Rubricella aquisinus]